LILKLVATFLCVNLFAAPIAFADQQTKEVAEPFYSESGEIALSEFLSLSLYKPFLLKDLKLKGRHRDEFYELRLGGRFLSDVEEEVEVIINFGLFNADGNFMSGCSDNEQISAEKRSILRCKFILAAAPKNARLTYSFVVLNAPNG
jgi:hypothetical protein